MFVARLLLLSVDVHLEESEKKMLLNKNGDRKNEAVLSIDTKLILLKKFRVLRRKATIQGGLKGKKTFSAGQITTQD